MWGSGELGASRGNRPHLGVDVITSLDKDVYAPFDFYCTGISYPYAGSDLVGVKGKTESGFEVRIWYFVPLQDILGTWVRKGQLIGYGDTLQNKYPGITDHLHIQLSKNGEFSEGLVWNGRTYFDFEKVT